MDRFGALDWNGKLLDAIARSPDGKVKVAFAYVNGGCGGTIKNIFFCSPGDPEDRSIGYIDLYIKDDDEAYVARVRWEEIERIDFIAEPIHRGGRRKVEVQMCTKCKAVQKQDLDRRRCAWCSHPTLTARSIPSTEYCEKFGHDLENALIAGMPGESGSNLYYSECSRCGVNRHVYMVMHDGKLVEATLSVARVEALSGEEECDPADDIPF